MNDPREALYTTPDMAAAFSPEAHVRQMLTFESALARAEARAGIIPTAAADAIAEAGRIDNFDVGAIYEEAALAGTPAIPLVRMLTEQVAAEGRAYVHWGATSQDAIDSATVLQVRAGLDLLEADLLELAVVSAALASEHRRTVMPGRTMLQQAVPIPFGLKAARWLGLVTRQIEALRRQRAVLALQFGGAAGTLAALGDQGMRVGELLAAELELELPDLPWHTERDRMAAIAAAVGVTAGAMAKIARDVALLAQTEVGEVSEASSPGKGGSSAMPHKRNPVDSTMALASAQLAVGQVTVVLSAMAQEHERGVGGWQAEWQAIPSLFLHTAGAVARVARAVGGLQVDTQSMRANLEQGGGVLMAEALTMALAPRLGRSQAQKMVRAACRQVADTGKPLRQVVLEDGDMREILSPESIETALDPGQYLGAADDLIDRALENYRAISGEHASTT